MSCKDQNHEQIISAVRKLLLLENGRLSGIRELGLVLNDLLEHLDVGGEQSRAFSDEITCIRDALADFNKLVLNEHDATDLYDELTRLTKD